MGNERLELVDIRAVVISLRLDKVLYKKGRAKRQSDNEVRSTPFMSSECQPRFALALGPGMGIEPNIPGQRSLKYSMCNRHGSRAPPQSSPHPHEFTFLN